MVDRVDRMLAELAERQALLGRVDQRRLEADDWAVLKALVTELITEAEAGNESVIELLDEVEASAWQNGGSAVAEDPPDCEPKRNGSDSVRGPNAPR